MLYSFIILSCFTVARATEYGPFTLAVKPAQKALIEARTTRKYFEDQWQQKEEQVHEILVTIFPKELAHIINKYRTPRTDQWRTIEISGLVHKSMEGRIIASTESIAVDIPLRYASHDNLYEIRNFDMFAACMIRLNRTANTHEWVNDMHEPWKKTRLCEFLSSTQTYGNSSFPASHFYVGLYKKLYFPFIDHFPLAIYWEKETIPLTKVHTPSIKQYSNGTYSHNIDDACYEILQEHGKLTPTITREDLNIVCTHCTNHIALPKENCYFLLIKHPVISHDDNLSYLCNGDEPLCRTFRTLRVYVSHKTEDSLKTCSNHKRKEVDTILSHAQLTKKLKQ